MGWDDCFYGNLGLQAHCVKSVRIRSCSGSHFPEFGLNTERYSVSLRIQSECEKMRTRKTSNADSFHAVFLANVQTIYPLKMSENPENIKKLEVF